MFEIVLCEYGLDYLYIREHWTMAALVLHIRRRNERLAAERDAVDTARGGGGARGDGLRPGEKRVSQPLQRFVEAERKAGRVKRMRRRSERLAANGGTA